MAMQEAPVERKVPTGTDGGLVDKAWDIQHRLEARAKNLGKGKYGRVLKMARKPDSEEFNQTAKVTAVGIVVIGFLGFLIYYIMGPLLHLQG
jgi:protein transport protein SEC61 subunit gamma-like protein